MRRHLISLILAITLMPGMSRAGAVNKNLDFPATWENVCADGKIFYPGFCKIPKDQRDDFAKYQHNKDNETWFFRAGKYYAQQRPSELKHFCDQALERHPNWVAPHFYLGSFYESAVDDDQAFAEYKKALDMKPCFGWALMNYSALLYKTGKHEEAMRVIDKGLTYCKDPEDAASQDCAFYLLQTKAKALLTLKRWKEVAQTLERASQLPGGLKDPMMRNQMCEAYLELGQWSKTIERATEAIKLAPKGPAAYLFRAKAYASINKNQQALDDVSFYLSKHAGDPCAEVQQVHLLRAVLYERLGKKALAQKERQFVKTDMKDFYKETFFSSESHKK